MSGIFISYGHDKFEPVVHRLYTDLIQKGFEVFKDNTESGIKPSMRYDLAIEEAIDNCDYFISILSTHSTRNNSVCLDEISRARELDKGIVPIRFEIVRVPFLICRYQWMDLFISTDTEGNPYYSESDYQKVLSKIVDIVKENKKIGANERLADVGCNYKLRPFDFSYIITTHSKGFVGREWLVSKIHNWKNDSNESVCWVLGDAGSGKTSIVSHMMANEDLFDAAHFCQSNNVESIDTRNIISSIVYQLCIQNKHYLDSLIASVDPSDIIECNLNELMLNFLVTAPSKSDVSKKFTIIIDAIDELGYDDQREFLDCLYEICSRSDNYVRFVITSRPDDLILAYINNNNSEHIWMDRSDNVEDNYQDCKGYIISYLETVDITTDEEVIDKMLEASGANFLYLKFLLEEITKSKSLSLENVERMPKKLGGIYLSYMNSLIKEITLDYYDEEVVPILEIMVSAKRPLNVEELSFLSGKSERTILRVFKKIRSLIKNEGQYYSLYHRSLEMWLTDKTVCDSDYYIDKKEGKQIIIREIKGALSDLCKRSEDDYMKQYAFNHLIENNEIGTIIDLIKIANDETEELFYIKLTDYDVNVIYDIIRNIGQAVSEEEFNEVIRNIMFYLRYQRYLDKGFDLCEQLLKDIGKNSPVIYACLLTQKANNYHYLKQERYDLSKPLFEEAIGILLKLPETKINLYMLSLSNEGVGICYKNMKMYEDAEEYYTRALEYSKKCYELYPGKMTRRGLAIDYSNMALKSKWKGDIDTMKEYYLAAHGLFEDNYKDHPAYDTRRDYMVSLNRIAEISDDNVKLELFTKALKLGEENCSLFPSLQSKRDVARSHVSLGDYYAKTDHTLAIENYLIALKIQKDNFESYMSIQNTDIYTKTLLKISDNQQDKEESIKYLDMAINAIEECMKFNSSQDLESKLNDIINKKAQIL